MHSGTVPLPLGGGPAPGGARSANVAARPAATARAAETAAAKRRRERAPAADAAGGPGRASTCRWPTWTGRSTTWCRPTLDEAAVPGVPGPGAVRRPAGRRLPARRGSTTSEHDGHAGVPGEGGLAGAGAAPRGGASWPAPWPTATPARWPTCCGSPCRRGTPAPRTTAGRARRRRQRSGRDIASAGRVGAASRRAAVGAGARGHGAGWAAYPAGPALLPGARRRPAPRAVLTALPGEDWPARLAEAVAATVHSGRGAVVVVPDARDLDRLDAALTAALGPDRHVALHAALGPAERYRRFLRARRGEVRGRDRHPGGRVRPVRRPGPGRDLGRRRRPARRAAGALPARPQVLLTRAQLAGAGALVGGDRAQRRGAAAGRDRLGAGDRRRPRDVVRRARPAVTPTGDDADRARDPAAVDRPAAEPRLAGRPGRAGRRRAGAGAGAAARLPAGGVLCGVSYAGPVRALRRAAGAALVARGRGLPVVRPAGGRLRLPPLRRRGGCGRRWSAPRRTAEELGRAFPGVPVRTSGRDGVLSTVAAEPALVVATPGRRAGGRRAATAPCCCSTPGRC